MNWSSFPFLRITFVLVCGIFTFGYFNITIKYLFTFFSGWLLLVWFYHFLVKSEYSYHPKTKSALLLISVFMFGGCLLQLKHQKYNAQIISSDEKTHIMIQGIITEQLKSENRLKFILHTEAFFINNIIKKTTNDIILTFEGSDSEAGSYKPGSRILVKTILKRIKKTTNPEAFDYAAYLSTKGIFQNGIVKPTQHKRVGSQTSHLMDYYIGMTSNFARQTLGKYISDNKILGIAEAVLLGRKLLLSDDMYKTYTDTGAIHVLSVSGLHVAIFTSIFIWLFSLVKNETWYWKIIKVCFLLATVWFYVMLTGAVPSVVRAGIMVSLYILGKNIAKGINTYNILSISALCMLIYNPDYLFQASFQFSYISLLSILYFQPKIKNWWTPSSGILKFIWNLVNVSLAAQILIFPFTVYYFHQFPSFFAISGIVAVPLVTLIIYAGSLLIFLEYIFNTFNQYIASIFSGLIRLLNNSLEIISHWPYSIIENIWITDVGLFLLVLTSMCFILWLETRNTGIFNITLFLGLLIIFENRQNDNMAKEARDLVVYDLYGGSLIDIIDIGRASQLVTGSLNHKNIDFAARNFRIKNKVTNNVQQVLDGDQFQHFICLNNQLIYLYLSDHELVRLRESICVDLLIVANGNHHLPDKVLSKFKPKRIVFDNSVKPWIIEKWLTLPDIQEIKVHQVKKDGAFVLSRY